MTNFNDLLAFLVRTPFHKKIYFYKQLAMNLTLCNRSIVSNPIVGDSMKVAAMATINEIINRVLGWIKVLESNNSSLDDHSCLSDIRNYAKTNTLVNEEVKIALTEAARQAVANGH